MKHIEHKGISSLMLHMLHSSKKSCVCLAFFFVGLMRLAIYLNLLNQIQTGVTKNAERQL